MLRALLIRPVIVGCIVGLLVPISVIVFRLGPQAVIEITAVIGFLGGALGATSSMRGTI